MHSSTKCVKSEYGRTVWYALPILPAVVLGVLTMICTGTSPVLWAQQAVACIVLPLLSKMLFRAAKRLPEMAWRSVLLILLAASLFGESVDGARRWLNCGVFQVNAAMLVLPAMVVVLWRVKTPYPALLAAAAVLSFQPDLSQLTAFSAAMLPLLWPRRNKPLWSLASIVLLGALAIRCLNVPVAISPVSYCEGILAMMGEIFWVLQAAGWVALAVIPLFFARLFYCHRKSEMASLAIYYVIISAFGVSGEYPVPFVGFGLSPLAGYWLAFLCIAVENMPEKQKKR